MKIPEMNALVAHISASARIHISWLECHNYLLDLSMGKMPNLLRNEQNIFLHELRKDMEWWANKERYIGKYFLNYRILDKRTASLRIGLIHRETSPATAHHLLAMLNSNHYLLVKC